MEKQRHLVHVNIPAAIYELIQQLAVNNGMYRSVPEFILECIRNRIHELTDQKIARQKLNIYYKRQKEKGMQSASSNVSKNKD
jgi:hypothetical protein